MSNNIEQAMRWLLEGKKIRGKRYAIGAYIYLTEEGIRSCKILVESLHSSVDYKLYEEPPIEYFDGREALRRFIAGKKVLRPIHGVPVLSMSYFIKIHEIEATDWYEIE